MVALNIDPLAGFMLIELVLPKSAITYQNGPKPKLDATPLETPALVEIKFIFPPSVEIPLLLSDIKTLFSFFAKIERS